MNTRTNTRKPQYLQGISGFCFARKHPKNGQKSDLKKGPKMGTSLQISEKNSETPCRKAENDVEKTFF